MSLTDLRLSVSQVHGPDAPTLHISVQNTNPNDALTILTWNSPLDALLVQLGLVSITPPGSDAPLDMPTIMVKRRMPPSEDSLVTLDPGETVSRTVELGERFVVPDQWTGDGSGGPSRIQVKGRWTAVWPGLRKEELLRTEKLASYGNRGGQGVLTGEYDSGVVQIQV